MSSMRTVTVEVPEDGGVAIVITNHSAMTVLVSNIDLRQVTGSRFLDGSSPSRVGSVDFWFKLEGRPSEIVSIEDAVGTLRLPERK